MPNPRRTFIREFKAGAVCLITEQDHSQAEVGLSEVKRLTMGRGILKAHPGFRGAVLELLLDAE
jgi:hypothetical protein